MRAIGASIRGAGPGGTVRSRLASRSRKSSIQALAGSSWMTWRKMYAMPAISSPKMMPLNAGLRRNAFSSDGPRTIAIATTMARNSAIRSTNRCGPRMLRRSLSAGSPSRTATGRRRRKFRDGNDNPVVLCGRPSVSRRAASRRQSRPRRRAGPGCGGRSGARFIAGSLLTVRAALQRQCGRAAQIAGNL